jgi:hypothetical protein
MQRCFRKHCTIVAESVAFLDSENVVFFNSVYTGNVFEALAGFVPYFPYFFLSI